MPIKAGWNVLRVVRADEDKGRRIGGTTYDAWKFKLVNMANEELEVCYVVPVGRKPSNLINDLIYLNIKKDWMDVLLVEKKRLLQITQMKPLKTAQQELEDLKRSFRGRYN